MVADNPIQFTIQQRLPQVLDIFTRANGWVYLGMARSGSIIVEQQVANRNLSLEIDVRKNVLHGDRGFNRFF